MAKYPGGVTVSGYIAPSDTLDVYATHKAQFGCGGYRSAADLNARDNITDIRREIGMIVYVISEKKEYRLEDGILNSNWVEVVSNGSGPSKQNYIIVDNILDREMIPDVLRTLGMIVYNIDDDKEYRLVSGITNNDWVELKSSGTSKQNYVIVNTLADIENYPISDRFIGLKVYASDVDREYRLTSGIDNVNWVEIQNITISDGVISPSDPDSTTPINVTNNTINEFFNTFGCINASQIVQTILGLTEDNAYDGVVSVEDSKVFSFRIKTDKFWFGDWIFFSGTTNLEPLKNNEVFIVVKQNGNTEVFDLFELMKTNTISSKIQVSGNKSIWYGYFRPENFGKCELTIYQTQDSIKVSNINKTIYLFKPNFTITDLETNTIAPSNIMITNQIINTRKYRFKILNDTSLIVKLAKVNVTEKGIDTENFNVINSTIKNIQSDTDYVLSIDSLREISIYGTYALVINGVDNGVSIPTYFYGPFLINKI